MKKTNFHTHTYRCKHAKKDKDEEYVLAAIENGYETLGFSDHVPWLYRTPFSTHTRMDIDDLYDYTDSIKALREKYKDQIEILLGFECEYFPEYMDYLKAMIKDVEADYIIFGNHHYMSDEINEYYGKSCDDTFMDHYFEGLVDGLNTGLYAYLCHPDLFVQGRKVFDKKAEELSHKICAFAKEKDVILEYNLEGMRKGRYYPCPEFWYIASLYHNKVIIGVDAHEANSLRRDDLYEEALKTISTLDLELVDDIKRRK